MRSLKQLLKLTLKWVLIRQNTNTGLCALTHWMYQKDIITESEWEKLTDFISEYRPKGWPQGTKRPKINWLKSYIISE